MEHLLSTLCHIINSTWGVAIISGIIATFLWWLITNVFFAANIKISDLQVYIGEKKLHDYYLIIQNRCIFRTIYDIECYCIFKDNNKELVYIKESKLYKFTALGPRPSWLKEMWNLPFGKRSTKFHETESEITNEIPHESYILLNSQILKAKEGLTVAFNQPLNTNKSLTQEDFEYQFRYDIIHTLFVVIKTKSPFGTSRTISRNLVCDLSLLDKRFNKITEHKRKKIRSFLRIDS